MSIEEERRRFEEVTWESAVVARSTKGFTLLLRHLTLDTDWIESDNDTTCLPISIAVWLYGFYLHVGDLIG